MKKWIYLLIGILLVSGICYFCINYPQEKKEIRIEEIPEPVDSLKLIFVGDIMGHLTQIHAAWRDGGDSLYNYLPVFENVKPYISTADIAVANLEVTFGGTPFTGYPSFSSPQELAVALKNTGFDLLMTANNHSLDREKAGLEGTINILDSLGFYYTGTFKDSADRKKKYPLIIRKNNFNVAFLNCTYGTNGKEETAPNLVNRIDTVQLAEDIRKVRKQQADYIVMYIHWGEEYSRMQSENQLLLARFLNKQGCDLIIGSHAHVVQPFTWYPREQDSIPVFFSLGNFVSNQRGRYRNGGIAVEIEILKKEGKVSVKKLCYEPFWVHRFHGKKGFQFRLVPVNDYLTDSSRYSLNKSDIELMYQFYTDTKQQLPQLNFSSFYVPRIDEAK